AAADDPLVGPVGPRPRPAAGHGPGRARRRGRAGAGEGRRLPARVVQRRRPVPAVRLRGQGGRAVLLREGLPRLPRQDPRAEPGRRPVQGQAGQVLRDRPGRHAGRRQQLRPRHPAEDDHVLRPVRRHAGPVRDGDLAPEHLPVPRDRPRRHRRRPELQHEPGRHREGAGHGQVEVQGRRVPRRAEPDHRPAGVEPVRAGPAAVEAGRQGREQGDPGVGRQAAGGGAGRGEGVAGRGGQGVGDGPGAGARPVRPGGRLLRRRGPRQAGGRRAQDAGDEQGGGGRAGRPQDVRRDRRRIGQGPEGAEGPVRDAGDDDRQEVPGRPDRQAGRDAGRGPGPSVGPV
ncbi:MAG: hypothetical protein AVDCRST_MAG64-3274, partial [uncultured Phycisphaerae bacterium]